eukprot:6491979-Amphidinium_carterae.1
MDHIGLNKNRISPILYFAELEWQTIIQRLWPQELNFFHIDAPTRRKHCLAHYQATTVSEEEYRFMALQAGLPDEKKAFADAQELGAWTMDLLWNEVLNRIDRVTAFTRKDDPTFKLKTKENVKGYRGVKAGNNEERLANYFETGATSALFQRDLFSVRRLLVALISHLPKKDEEAFWQWYPAYGYRFPHYNTVADKEQRDVHDSYNDWEVPFTSEDIPEGYFAEKPTVKRDQPKAIPVVPDFIPEPRPANKKPAYPSFRQRCADASMDEPTRVIEDDWLTGCWYSRTHAHGYFTFTDHREKIGWLGYISQNEKDKYWKLKHKQQCAFQKIELQTSMRFYRKMNPANDVFKMLRCHGLQAIMQAIDEALYECFCTDHLVFEGQEAEWINQLKS